AFLHRARYFLIRVRSWSLGKKASATASVAAAPHSTLRMSWGKSRRSVMTSQTSFRQLSRQVCRLASSGRFAVMLASLRARSVRLKQRRGIEGSIGKPRKLAIDRPQNFDDVLAGGEFFVHADREPLDDLRIGGERSWRDSLPRSVEIIGDVERMRRGL